VLFLGILFVPGVSLVTASSGQQEIRAAFDAFARKSLSRRAALSRPLGGTPTITETPGGFKATITEIDTRSLSVSVEPTGSPAAPYLGIMRYLVVTGSCTGTTREAAAAGPFLKEKVTKTTELFLYSNGTWGKG
jgi:hypothetical protein